MAAHIETQLSEAIRWFVQLMWYNGLTMAKKTGVVIYQAKSGAIELRGDFSKETIWATQAQIAEVFAIERSVVTKHIRNILKDKELDERSVCANFAHTAKDGKTYQVAYYNLDVILAVGYRTNSSRAIQFRQWATKTLRAHIIDGYTINKSRIKYNYDTFLQSVADIQALLPDNQTIDPKSILELIKEFASTWMSLDAYDRELLTVSGATKKSITLTGQQLTDAIGNLRATLLQKGEDTDIFAREKTAQSITGIVGNVMQSFAGKPIYPTIEEKAAHLLYFMVKNHPFVDGNKRSGAFAFVWFLRKTGVAGGKNINPAALTVLTLLIAESNPKKKEQMIALVTTLLSVKS